MKKPSIWYWIIAGLFLLWNIFGCAIYVMDVSMSDAQYAEAYGEAMAAVRDIYPSWAMAFYAIAVWVGLLAAITLLLRRSVSVWLFMISLLSAIICFIPNFTTSALKEAAGSTFWVMPLIVVSLGILEVWFSRRARANGTLR